MASAVVLAMFFIVPAVRDTDPASVGMSTHVNQRGAYEIAHPSDWDVASRGSTTRLAATDREVIVGIGSAPRGKLADAASEFASSVVASYTRVRIHTQLAEEVNGMPAILVSGRGTNANNVGIRWLAVTVDGGARNYGISIFTREDAPPASVAPLLDRMLASFRPLRRG